jgi:hypothetical protein
MRQAVVYNTRSTSFPRSSLEYGIHRVSKLLYVSISLDVHLLNASYFGSANPRQCPEA